MNDIGNIALIAQDSGKTYLPLLKPNGGSGRFSIHFGWFYIFNSLLKTKFLTHSASLFHISVSFTKALICVDSVVWNCCILQKNSNILSYSLYLLSFKVVFKDTFYRQGCRLMIHSNNNWKSISSIERSRVFWLI